MNATRKQVAVVVGATSKWQADGRNTKLAHGKTLDDSALPVGIRWGVGGAIAQKFAREGFFVVLTTRKAENAAGLEKAIVGDGGQCMTVELDLVSRDSIARAFETIRTHAGDPDVLVYNAGYLEGRDLPPDKELLEHVPFEIFETADHVAVRGPFLVAREVLPAMRTRGAGREGVAPRWSPWVHGRPARARTVYGEQASGGAVCPPRGAVRPAHGTERHRPGAGARGPPLRRGLDDGPARRIRAGGGRASDRLACLKQPERC